MSDHRVNETIRHSEKNPALLFLIGSCGLLVIGVWSSSSSSWLIIISIFLILLFGSRLIIASRNNDMLEQQMSQFQRESQKQIETTRSKADAMLLSIDAEITRKQKELEKHLRVVTD